MKIIIFGASGSGTTTLGKSLAEKLKWAHLDADDYYWKKTPIPFQIKLPKEARNENLKRDFNSHQYAIISGSLMTWGPYWNHAFDLGIFLWLPQEIRMERLRIRELHRYGDQLDRDEQIKQTSEAFLSWAKQYDDESFDGRSIRQHKQWIALLSCPILELMGDISREERIRVSLEEINKHSLDT